MVRSSLQLRPFVLTYPDLSERRERFVQLMMDTSSHPATYRRLFHVKALHQEFVPIEQQLLLVDHYLNYCQTIIRSKQADQQDFADNPIKQENTSQALHGAALALIWLKSEQWQLELAWAQSLRERILVQLRHPEVAIEGETS